MISRTTCFLYASLFTFLTLSGCSKCSSGAAPTDATSAKAAVTKAQYIEKVDALCRRNDDKLASELENMAKPTTPEEALKWSIDATNKSLDSQEALAKEIQALEQPSEDSALLQQVFQGDAKRRETARAFAQALQGDISKGELDERKEQIKSVAKEISDLAKKYGFTFCFIANENPAE